MHLRKRGATYHYLAEVGGKAYSGNTYETSLVAARRFAADRLRPVLQAQTIDDLLRARLAALAQRRPVALAEAWEQYERVPRRKAAESRRSDDNAAKWALFVRWMAGSSPQVETVGEVSQDHARAYVHHLGSAYVWSAATRNDHVRTCRAVFRALVPLVGLETNPFDCIPDLEADTVPREAFSPAELATIGEKSRETWLYPLVLIGLTTGLREGDSCLLTWADVDLERREIRRRQNKTRRIASIPMMPALYDYLGQHYGRTIWATTPPRPEDYVHPDLADRYLLRRTSIGREFGLFLEDDCGIPTTRIVEGRARPCKTKDVHSLRHTFVYLAALNGIPLPVVQAIVGHLDDAMTRAYMHHASAQDRLTAVAALPNYLHPST